MTRDWQLFDVFVKTRLHEAKEKTDAPIAIPVFLESRDAFRFFDSTLCKKISNDPNWLSQSFVFSTKNRHAGPPDETVLEQRASSPEA